MTVVSDLVARFRADTADWEPKLVQAEAAARSFGDEVAHLDSHLLKVKDAAGIAATALGGTFAAGIVGAIAMTKSYNSEIEQLGVQFNAIFGGSSRGGAQLQMVEDFSAKMGIATSQVAAMSKELQLGTQGMHDSQADWQKLTDIASAHGASVVGVAHSITAAYDMIQRAMLTGSGGGSMATRGLLSEKLITPETAAQVEQLIAHGASMTKVWDALLSGADKVKGSGDAAAKTLSGLTSTFHTLLTADVGEAFAPLYNGVKRVEGAINDLLGSAGMREMVHSIADAVGGVGHVFDDMAGKVKSFGDKINAEGFSGLLAHLKQIGPELGVVSGLMAEFGSEFVGRLPIINRFAGPFIQFLDDGRGGLLGLVVASSQGREALENLLSAVGDLAKSLFQAGGAIHPLLVAVQQIAAFLINAAAAVVEFVAQHKMITEMAVAVFALWEAFKIGVNVMQGLRALGEFIAVLDQKMQGYVGSVGKKQAAEDTAAVASKKQLEANVELTKSMNALAEAIAAASEAQQQLNGVQNVGVGSSQRLSIATKSNALAEVAQAEGAGAEVASGSLLSRMGGGATRATGMSMGGLGGILGLGIGGFALQSLGQHVGGTAGGAMSTGGEMMQGAAMGAMVGSFLPGGPLTTVLGGVVGAAVPLIGHLFSLGDSASAAAQALKKMHEDNSQFLQAHAPNPSDLNDIITKDAIVRAHAEDQYSAPRAALGSGLAHLRALGVIPGTDAQGLPTKEAMANIAHTYAPGTPGALANPDFARRVMSAWADVGSETNLLRGAYKEYGPDVDKTDAGEQRARSFMAEMHHQLPKESQQHLIDLVKAANIDIRADMKPDELTKNIQLAMGALGPIIDGKMFSPGGMALGNWTALLNEGTDVPGVGFTSMAGTQGQRKFGMTADMVNSLGSWQMGFQNTSMIDRFVDAGALKRDAKGNISGETTSQIQQDITLLDLAHQKTAADHQAAEAAFAYSEAVYQAGQADHARIKALQGVEQALFGLQKAQFNVTRALFDASVENATQANSLAHFSEAARGHTDTYWNFSTTVMKLSDEHKHLADAVQIAVTAATAAGAKYDDVNRAYQRMSDTLQILTDRQKAFQDIMNRPLAGTMAYDKQLRDNTNAQDAIKMQMDALKLQGIYDKDPRMTALQYQLNVLSTQRDTIESKKDLDVGNKQDQLKFAAGKDMEVTFGAAMKAAQGVGDLNKQVNSLTHHLDDEKIKVDEATKTYDIWKTKADLMVQALDAVASSDQNLIQQHEKLRDATIGVHQAFIGLSDAQWGVMSADHNIQVAHHSVENAAYGIKEAEFQREKQTKQTELTAISAISSLVTQGVNFGRMAAGGAELSMQDVFKNAMQNLPPDVQKLVKDWLAAMTASAPNGGVGNPNASGFGRHAEGGIESHDPSIYGMVHGTRMFNEPETGGEAYIPLGANKRSTALPVLRQVNALMGLETFAQGGFSEALGLARDNAMRTGIPVSVMLTQSANETANWTSFLWKSKNNPAGLGAYSNAVGGAYPSPAVGWASYADHLLGIGEAGQGKFVADLRAGATPIQLLRDIQNSPWAGGHYGYSALEAAYPRFAPYDMPGLMVPPHFTGATDTGPGRTSVVDANAAEAAKLALGMEALPRELAMTGIVASAAVKPAVHALMGSAIGQLGALALGSLGFIGAGIPHYGDGGLALTPHLAMVGERPEAILPLDKMHGLGSSITIGDGAIQVSIVVHGNAPHDLVDEVRDAVSDALQDLVGSVRAKAG